MKKLVLGIITIVAISFNGYANNEIEKLKKTELDIKTISSECKVSFLDVIGICHIRIVDNRTGETVYQISLPANDAEACKRMAQATLEAYVDGKL